MVTAESKLDIPSTHSVLGEGIDTGSEPSDAEEASLEAGDALEKTASQMCNDQESPELCAHKSILCDDANHKENVRRPVAFVRSSIKKNAAMGRNIAKQSTTKSAK